jgi:hypothetical protein
MRFPANQRIVLRPDILGEVGNDLHRPFGDDMSANRLSEWRFAKIEAILRLEPLPAFGDETDQRNRHPAELPSQFDDIVEGGLRRSVEDIITLECGQTGTVSDVGTRRNRHARSFARALYNIRRVSESVPKQFAGCLIAAAMVADRVQAIIRRSSMTRS